MPRIHIDPYDPDSIENAHLDALAQERRRRPPRRKHCAKARYGTHAEAIEALHTIWARPRWGGTLPSRAYECDRCNGWHLTSQPHIGAPARRQPTSGQLVDLNARRRWETPDGDDDPTPPGAAALTPQALVDTSGPLPPPGGQRETSATGLRTGTAATPQAPAWNSPDTYKDQHRTAT